VDSFDMDRAKIGCEYRRWAEVTHYHDTWRILVTVVLKFRVSCNFSRCLILLLLPKPPSCFSFVYKVGI
jgi:hypothetical protein